MNIKQTSARYNEGKIQSREIDPDFILGIGEVLTKSRVKYDHFNWQKPTNFSTPYESLMRHLMAFQKGEEIDQETGCHHLLHAATNIMFLHYHAINNTGIDDRGFKKELTSGESCDIIKIGDIVSIKKDNEYKGLEAKVVKLKTINNKIGAIVEVKSNYELKRIRFLLSELKKIN